MKRKRVATELCVADGAHLSDHAHPTQSCIACDFMFADRTTLREASRMDDLALTIRVARPKDAADVARIYIESWHDTYPAVLSSALLCSMTPRGQTARWQG